MDHDFIVGFTLFGKKSYKTMYRHFSKLEHAKMFASNVNIKDNCKLYVDYEYYKEIIEKQQKEIEELHREINQRIKLKLENERCADEDFIYKGKIKAKIEEYKKHCSECGFKHLDICKHCFYTDRIKLCKEIIDESLKKGK